MNSTTQTTGTSGLQQNDYSSHSVVTGSINVAPHLLTVSDVNQYIAPYVLERLEDSLAWDKDEAQSEPEVKRDSVKVALDRYEQSKRYRPVFIEEPYSQYKQADVAHELDYSDEEDDDSSSEEDEDQENLEPTPTSSSEDETSDESDDEGRDDEADLVQSSKRERGKARMIASVDDEHIVAPEDNVTDSEIEDMDNELSGVTWVNDPVLIGPQNASELTEPQVENNDEVNAGQEHVVMEAPDHLLEMMERPQAPANMVRYLETDPTVESGWVDFQHTNAGVHALNGNQDQQKTEAIAAMVKKEPDFTDPNIYKPSLPNADLPAGKAIEIQQEAEKLAKQNADLMKAAADRANLDAQKNALTLNELAKSDQGTAIAALEDANIKARTNALALLAKNEALTAEANKKKDENSTAAKVIGSLTNPFTAIGNLIELIPGADGAKKAMEKWGEKVDSTLLTAVGGGKGALTDLAKDLNLTGGLGGGGAGNNNNNNNGNNPGGGGGNQGDNKGSGSTGADNTKSSQDFYAPFRYPVDNFNYPDPQEERYRIDLGKSTNSSTEIHNEGVPPGTHTVTTQNTTTTVTPINYHTQGHSDRDTFSQHFGDKTHNPFPISFLPELYTARENQVIHQNVADLQLTYFHQQLAPTNSITALDTTLAPNPQRVLPKFTGTVALSPVSFVFGTETAMSSTTVGSVPTGRHKHSKFNTAITYYEYNAQALGANGYAQLQKVEERFVLGHKPDSSYAGYVTDSERLKDKDKIRSFIRQKTKQKVMSWEQVYNTHNRVTKIIKKFVDESEGEITQQSSVAMMCDGEVVLVNPEGVAITVEHNKQMPVTTGKNFLPAREFFTQLLTERPGITLPSDPSLADIKPEPVADTCSTYTSVTTTTTITMTGKKKPVKAGVVLNYEFCDPEYTGNTTINNSLKLKMDNDSSYTLNPQTTKIVDSLRTGQVQDVSSLLRNNGDHFNNLTNGTIIAHVMSKFTSGEYNRGSTIQVGLRLLAMLHLGQGIEVNQTIEKFCANVNLHTFTNNDAWANYFPFTSNAALLPAVNAIRMTETLMATSMTNNTMSVFGYEHWGTTCAMVPVGTAWNNRPGALAYFILAHMEYPFTYYGPATTARTIYEANGTAHNVATTVDWIDHASQVYIPGPKTTVLLINSERMTTVADVTVGDVVPILVNSANPAVPVDIALALDDKWTNLNFGQILEAFNIWAAYYATDADMMVLRRIAPQLCYRSWPLPVANHDTSGFSCTWWDISYGLAPAGLRHLKPYYNNADDPATLPFLTCTLPYGAMTNGRAYTGSHCLAASSIELPPYNPLLEYLVAAHYVDKVLLKLKLFDGHPLVITTRSHLLADDMQYTVDAMREYQGYKTTDLVQNAAMGERNPRATYDIATVFTRLIEGLTDSRASAIVRNMFRNEWTNGHHGADSSVDMKKMYWGACIGTRSDVQTYHPLFAIEYNTVSKFDYGRYTQRYLQDQGYVAMEPPGRMEITERSRYSDLNSIMPLATPATWIWRALSLTTRGYEVMSTNVTNRFMLATVVNALGYTLPVDQASAYAWYITSQSLVPMYGSSYFSYSAVIGDISYIKVCITAHASQRINLFGVTTFDNVDVRNDQCRHHVTCLQAADESDAGDVLGSRAIAGSEGKK